MTNEEKMTPEEAIAEISFLKVAVNKVMEQALEMAIQALENHDTFMKYAYSQGKHDALSQEPCDDAISREMALKECHDIVVDGERYRVIQEETLLGLPPVNPQPCEGCEYKLRGEVEQKTGHWIEHPEIETSTPEYLMFYECSECGDRQCFCKSDIHKKRFCTNCGARMVEPQESEG